MGRAVLGPAYGTCAVDVAGAQEFCHLRRPKPNGRPLRHRIRRYEGEDLALQHLQWPVEKTTVTEGRHHPVPNLSLSSLSSPLYFCCLLSTPSAGWIFISSLKVASRVWLLLLSQLGSVVRCTASVWSVSHLLKFSPRCYEARRICVRTGRGNGGGMGEARSRGSGGKGLREAITICSTYETLFTSLLHDQKEERLLPCLSLTNITWAYGLFFWLPA